MSPLEAKALLLEEASKRLFHHSGEGSVEEVEEALAKGGDVAYSESHGWTPLHIAVIHQPKRYPEIVRALLAKRADPDLEDTQGRTPLLFASMYGLHESVKDLLNVSKNHYTADPHGYNALTHAARNGHHLVIRELLAARVDPASAHSSEVQNPHIRRLLDNRVAERDAFDNSASMPAASAGEL